jgi:glycosyltransferase involved in cell wall biosynthesis
MEVGSEFYFKVSVIIPVFNRVKFLSNAINSVVHLPEVGEVIIVDDGSTDNSLQVAKSFSNENSKVKVIQHIFKNNRGVSISRNLGIKTATMPYIAFLDSDDWYLKNRFLKDRKIFERFPNADIVCSRTILEENLSDFTKLDGIGYDIRKEIGYNIKPIEFFQKISELKTPLTNTNGITIKRSFLLKNKLFDERLRLHEDTELWKRLMRTGNTYMGFMENPVAVIRRHENNTITSRNRKSELKAIAVYINNIGLEELHDFEINLLFKRVLRQKSRKHINNHWKRRIFYYLNYIRLTGYKKKFLRCIELKYKDLQI